jgi:hypothetical protein
MEYGVMQMPKLPGLLITCPGNSNWLPMRMENQILTCFKPDIPEVIFMETRGAPAFPVWSDSGLSWIDSVRRIITKSDKNYGLQGNVVI